MPEWGLFVCSELFSFSFVIFSHAMPFSFAFIALLKSLTLSYLSYIIKNNALQSYGKFQTLIFSQAFFFSFSYHPLFFIWKYRCTARSLTLSFASQVRSMFRNLNMTQLYNDSDRIYLCLCL